MNNTNTNAVETNGFCGYYPEMGEARPNAEIDATLSHYGNHYFLKTSLVLSGRGITFLGSLKASELTPQAQHKTGWNQYKVTIKAFELICQQHKVASEFLL